MRRQVSRVIDIRREVHDSTFLAYKKSVVRKLPLGILDHFRNLWRRPAPLERWHAVSEHQGITRPWLVDARARRDSLQGGRTTNVMRQCEILIETRAELSEGQFGTSGGATATVRLWPRADVANVCYRPIADVSRLSQVGPKADPCHARRSADRPTAAREVPWPIDTSRRERPAW